MGSGLIRQGRRHSWMAPGHGLSSRLVSLISGFQSFGGEGGEGGKEGN